MALNNETPTVETAAVAGALPGTEGKAKPGRKSAAGRDAAVGKNTPGVKPARSTETKASIAPKKLKSPKGVTTETLMEATGWQAHSVRGLLSAVVKKKLGLSLVSETGKDGVHEAARHGEQHEHRLIKIVDHRIERV